MDEPDYDPDEIVQMNVRVPRYLRDTVDARRAILPLSRDKWVARALTWALTQQPRTPVTTAPGKRTPRSPLVARRPFANRVEFYCDSRGDWRWRFIAVETGDVLGDSGQGYSDLRDARNAIHRILLANETAPVQFATHTMQETRP